MIMNPIKDRLKQLAVKSYVFGRAAAAAVALGLIEIFASPRGRRMLAVGAILGAVVLLALRPPVQIVPPGEVGVRINRLTGAVRAVPEGPALVLPLIHELRHYSLREQIYRPTESAAADGAAPYQTVEGLSV